MTKKASYFSDMAANWGIQAIIIMMVIVSVYGHTLDVPFYLDDFSSIVESPAIYNLFDLKRLWQVMPLRVVGNFTFALNYHFAQFQVTGYHIVNILFHIFAGFAVLALAKGLVKTPAMTGTISKKAVKWLPLLVSILFVLHPLQTQAVTYTVQRLAAMAAMFYLASLACYLKSRLACANLHKYFWAVCTLLFAVLAFFTKQNTVTLPLAIFLVEIVFFSSNRIRLAIITTATFFSLFALWLVLSMIYHVDPFSLNSLQNISLETTSISREQYFLTQLKVLWIYIKLYFWPLGLHLDYDVPLVSGFFHWKNIFALSGHLSLIAGGILLVRRLPLLAFAILFYYLAHLVESSIIPIRDVCFEHRTYLPNFGLSLGVGWLLTCLLPRYLGWRKVALACLALFFVMGVTTWHRNEMWRDPIRFWLDCTKRSPKKARPFSALGKYLLEAGKNEEAAEALQKALKQSDSNNSGSYKMNETTAVSFVAVLRRLGKYDEALKFADHTLKQKLSPLNRSKILNNKGNIYFNRKQHNKAKICYQNALRSYPENLTAMSNLGLIFALRGDVLKAKEMFQQVLKRNPHDKDVLRKLSSLSERNPRPKKGRLPPLK